MLVIKIAVLLLLVLLVVQGYGHGEKYLKQLIKIKQQSYEKISKSKSNDYHEVIFCIKQKNREYIEKLLIAVSTPTSSKYGQHLTREEIADITSNPIATNNVIDFLKANGITTYEKSTYGEYIKATATISKWENLFSTKFHKYSNDDGHVIHRSHTEVKIPSELSDHVNFVLKTKDFPLKNLRKPVRSSRSKSSSTSSSSSSASSSSSSTSSSGVNGVPPGIPPACGYNGAGLVNIACLTSFYAINVNKTAVAKAAVGLKNLTQAVYETSNQTFSVADLSKFQTSQQIPQDPVDNVYCNKTSSCEYIGPCTDEDNCAEANLDVQYIMGIARNVTTQVWYVSGDWDDLVVSLAEPGAPNVVSMSYGSAESSVAISQIQTFDTEAIKLGLMGTTLIVSSGDDGVGSNIAGVSSILCGYNPEWPTSSPWVTSVGATQFASSGEEIACQGDLGGVITSGGGFSNYYSRPTWQSEAVEDYFSNLTFVPYPGYNINGRGYPDVALLGANYSIIVNGSEAFVSGTSASAPVFAAMVSLMNSNRLAINSSLLGWLNPALYEVLSLGGHLFPYDPYSAGDIISGNNKCTAIGDVCCAQGFSAGPQWDPVTGLGSVNFTHMNNLLINHLMNLSIHTQQPTFAPTLNPQPSQLPTHSPVADAPGYYAYVSTYENQQCSGVSPHVTAFQTERCYPVDNTGLYLLFQCESLTGGSIYNGSHIIFQEADAYYAQVSLYDDSNCKNNVLSYNFNYGCSQTLTSTGYLSSQVLCSNSSTYKTSFPLATSGGQSYSVLQGFLGDTCKDCSLNGCDNLVYLTAFLNNHCFNSFLFGYTLDYILGSDGIDGSLKFKADVTRKTQKLTLDLYTNRACSGVAVPGPLQTGCTALAITDDDDYYAGGGTIVTEWRWTAYPLPASFTKGLSKGVIAGIVLSVLFVCSAIAYYFYRRMLFKRQLQNSLLDPLTANSSAPVPTTANRIPTGTILKVTPLVANPTITTRDSVPNPLVATPVTSNL